MVLGLMERAFLCLCVVLILILKIEVKYNVAKIVHIDSYTFTIRRLGVIGGSFYVSLYC